jgi:hypothetical protein
MEVRAAYRVLLRHCRRLPSGNEEAAGLEREVRRRFRAGVAEEEEAKIRALRLTATDTANLVKTMSVRKALLDDWAGEKMGQTERISSRSVVPVCVFFFLAISAPNWTQSTFSATRVGLAMPEEYKG